MALLNKGFRTPPPIKPKAGIPKKSFPFKKGGFGGDAKKIISKEVILPFTKAISEVIRGPKISRKKAGEKVTKEKKQGAADLLIFGYRGNKEKQKAKEKRPSTSLGGKHPGYITKQSYKQHIKKKFHQYYRHKGPTPFHKIWKERLEKVIPFNPQGFLRHKEGRLKQVELYYKLEIAKTKDPVKQKDLKEDLRLVQDLRKELKK